MPSLTRVPSVGTFGWVRLSHLNLIVSDVAFVTPAHCRADQEGMILPRLTDQLISVHGANVGHQLHFDKPALCCQTVNGIAMQVL